MEGDAEAGGDFPGGQTGLSRRGRVGVQNRDIHIDIAFFLINDEAVKAFSFGIIITEIYQRLRGGLKLWANITYHA